MSRLELYSYAACPFAQRTRMALIEKNLAFQLIEVDVASPPPGFREISPYGKVPLLRHGGGTIYESTIINQYLDEVFPERPLMPGTPLERAQARIWMDYCDTRFLPAAHRLLAESADEGRRAGNVARLTEVLRFIESEGLRRLGAGPYFFGGQVTLTDLQFAPFFERFGVYEQLGGAEWPADCTRLRAWLDAMRARDSFQSTARPIEYHIEARRRMLERVAGAPRTRPAGAGA